ncbi:MAG TPA: hypothetical protein PLX35_17210 [Cyclobacteriaceae bacterium]|nr:hypothetical protein [Cyclobacteriaceae bacterium]
MTWLDVIGTWRGRVAIIFCMATLGMIVFYMPHFYHDILTPKPGIRLQDPVLDMFTPRDWSLIVFFILYASILQTLLMGYKQPKIILVGLTAYSVVNVFRLITMYGLTLEPPTDMILLLDPISSIAYPDKGFAKDLFFSGHVSTVFVLVLVEPNAIARSIKLAGTLVMAVLLAWQHVHYSIDLIAALLVAWGAVVLIRRVLPLGATQ